MFVQGSNEPLVITFDESVEHLTKILVTVWCEDGGEKLVKSWRENDMQIAQNTIICPLTEKETAAFKPPTLAVNIKGLDENGTTMIYEEILIDVMARHDGGITLTEDA